ncbi:protease modulator HflC [Corticibacter populi]|uniref:Protein HflC n=1 Tax=Corticibacter populi TaxID=1550736 RepID=A0A3M6QZ63_9BURK|nr:protease modulator HflC [Corticibacter populi]RMX07822.1 protease modulator HflC [Corticibacter populi]RZS35055.1 protease FtsH subunit HflC [Corticibacter populi]
MNRTGFWTVLLLIVLAVVSSLMFVVDQRKFGVVYQLSEIKRVVDQPGLHFKFLPAPLQTVSYLDKRLLMLESQVTEPSLTAEKQWVVIDWYVRWRIVEPSTYIRNVGRTEAAGAAQLSRVVRSAFQEEVNRRTVRELLSEKRESLMADVKQKLQDSVTGGARPWGIEIADVRITRVDYSKAITESVFTRMKAERTRVANELRATGHAEGERIRADADRQRTVTLANAYKESQQIRAEGDSASNRVYAQAYGRDPQFAQFYRSLEAYRNSLGLSGDLMVLDPSSSEFFKAMRGSGVAP